MQAWVLHDISNIRHEQAEIPALSKGEVLVRVTAAGICGSDIPRIYQTGAHVAPLIPGHEFSGEVVEVREDSSLDWLNKRVGVFPLIPCRECGPCKMGKYEMCRNYSYLGSRRDGGFAEYVSVPEDNLILLPDSVTNEQAAMLEPMSVAVHAIRRVNPTKEDTVVVEGLGTIGLFITMFLRDMGIQKILTIGNKEFQRTNALALGIDPDSYFDSRLGNVDEWILSKTNNIGSDVFFECVGRSATVSTAVNCGGPAGRVVMVGNPASDMTFARDIYWKILRHQLTVTGTWNSTFNGTEEDDWHYTLSRLEAGVIHPERFITHRFALEELEQGFHIMRDKSEDYIKIMAVM